MTLNVTHCLDQGIIQLEEVQCPLVRKFKKREMWHRRI